MVLAREHWHDQLSRAMVDLSEAIRAARHEALARSRSLFLNTTARLAQSHRWKVDDVFTRSVRRKHTLAISVHCDHSVDVIYFLGTISKSKVTEIAWAPECDMIHLDLLASMRVA